MYLGGCNEWTTKSKSKTCSRQARLGKCLEMWGLSCPNLKLPKQSTHPCLYMKEMRWGGSTVRAWCCSSSIQLQARVNTLFKDEQSPLRGKPWSFQPSQEGHKWAQETNGGLHKRNELNLTAPEWGSEQTGPCAPALGTDLGTNRCEAVASLNLLFLKLQDYYLILFLIQQLP